MAARLVVGIAFIVAGVVQVALWLFARFVTLDHPERVEASGRMSTLLGLELALLLIGFTACLLGSGRAIRIARLSATGCILMAVAVAAIGATSTGASEPLLGLLATIPLLAVPGLILWLSTRWMQRARKAASPP